MYVYTIYSMAKMRKVYYKCYTTLSYAKKKLKELKKVYPEKIWWIEKQRVNNSTFKTIKIYRGV